MTAVTVEAGGQRGRFSLTIGVTIAAVIVWHLVFAAVCGWALVNIAGAVWRLEALQRTAIGTGAAIGLGVNLLAALLVWRGVRLGRTLSFTVNYLALVLAIIALFQSLDLASYGDRLAGAFNRAFLPFVGLAIAAAWIVVARRLSGRIHASSSDSLPGWIPRVASVMQWIGLVAGAVFALWWLWSLDLPLLASEFGAAFAPSAATNAALVVGVALTWLAARAMWSTRMAQHFGVRSDQLEAQSGWLFLSPNLIGFVLFFAGPLIFSLVISFYEWNGITDATFVGLNNYTQTLGLNVASSDAALPTGYEGILTLPFGVLGASDPLFWRAIGNILVFLALAVPLAVVPALVLASLIDIGYRGTKAFRTIFFVPAVAGVIGVTLIWKQMLNSTVGFINWFIGWFNGVVNAVLPGDPLPQPVEIGWLSDPSVALFAVIIVFGWSQFGFNTVLFTAGMQGIPRELHEAAELDGAGPWRRFFSITLPSLRATTFFVVASTIILALQLFDIVYALNQPNPVGFPDNATLTPVVYLYQLGFQQDAFGKASAVAWVLFIIIFTLTLVQFRRQRRYAEES